MNSSNYGTYGRTRSFTDIYPNVNDFRMDVKDCGFDMDLNDIDIDAIYYLLYANHGNDHIASSDENRFKYKMFSIIFMHGPTWARKMELQKKLRHLNDDDIFTGSTNIINHAANPSTPPSTNTLEELIQIDEQNTQKVKRSKLDGYSLMIQFLKDDFTEKFMAKFNPLFRTIIYQNEVYYEEDNDGC